MQSSSAGLTGVRAGYILILLKQGLLQLLPDVTDLPASGHIHSCTHIVYIVNSE